MVDAVENKFYKTRAETGGFIFETTMSTAETGGGVMLTSSHDSKPQGFAAKIKSVPIVFFKGILKKALIEDLQDIKTAVERT